MRLSEIQPFVRIALSAVLTADVPSITHTTLTTPDCRLFLITSGGGEFVIDGKSYTAAPYDCILFQAGTTYSWYPDSVTGFSYLAANFDYTQNFLHFRKSFHPRSISDEQRYQAFESIHFDDADCLNAPIVLHNAVMLHERFQMLNVEYRLGGEFRDELLSALLKSIIVSIVRQYGEQDTKSRYEVRAIIDFIEKNYWKPLNNQQIADVFGYNPIYLSRKFRDCTGVPLHSFLTAYRIDAAAELLRTQDIPVSRIVELTGFSDVCRFSKAFRNAMGVPPTEYRKRFR